MDVLIAFDDKLLIGDIKTVAGDLETDPSLRTAVVISIFTDALANPDDELPAGETDRRGWWGDLLPEVEGDKIGSRRWLYVREKQSPETAEKIREADQEALQWLIDDGIAASVSVTTEWIERGVLAEEIKITKPDGDQVNWRFNQLWENL
ncbi:phage GP46 family protein [Thalassospira sp.]|uniref:phage GP46 family protein n=1 Tax=Thalassospira sp. TaxID=1912094 RepID=UPI000C6A3DBC|nr:phage GP46 family protein [Thalassospira sp.]MBC06365.1 hypothetical protein [Thalassospira sp.]